AWLLQMNLPIYCDLPPGSKKHIFLPNNPITTPPLEIVKQGNEAIANFFAQMQNQTEDHLFEAKMLVVGEPGAGKTSLVRKVQDPEADLPEENETTKGIDVKQYYFPLIPEDYPSFNTQKN
ncbi:MAG: hypothetical protein MJK04_35130, partial [Psychrosphaera sp.]|nr:hypothetical protein [Psychrosphaera sp.]